MGFSQGTCASLWHPSGGPELDKVYQGSQGCTYMHHHSTHSPALCFSRSTKGIQGRSDGGLRMRPPFLSTFHWRQPCLPFITCPDNFCPQWTMPPDSTPWAYVSLLPLEALHCHLTVPCFNLGAPRRPPLLWGQQLCKYESVCPMKRSANTLWGIAFFS